MRFDELVNTINARAASLGLPCAFGDSYTRNVLANGITGYFVFFDVPGSTIDVVNSIGNTGFSVTLQVLGTSWYIRDEAKELDVLTQTSLYITDIIRKMGCSSSITGLTVTKVQNIYESPKSGWQATFTIA